MLYEVRVVKETLYRAVVEAPDEGTAIKMVQAKAGGEPLPQEPGAPKMMGLRTDKKFTAAVAYRLAREEGP